MRRVTALWGWGCHPPWPLRPHRAGEHHL